MSDSQVYFGARSPELLKGVRRVFGCDIVKDAYLLGSAYGDIDGSDIIRIMDDAEAFEIDDDFDVELPTAGEILIEFINGNKVSISTSEWGFLTQITKPVRIFSRNEETPNS